MIIAGPCVLQTDSLALEIAEKLRQIRELHKVDIVFKGSFDKANRTQSRSPRGPGIEEGLRILEKVRDCTDLPVTTDLHLPNQAVAISQVCDLLQIPAFLSRQTDLLLAAAATGKPVTVKKGQFMAPEDMKFVFEKLREGRHVSGQAGPSDDCGVLLCERGTFFGYGRLVNDMTGLLIMRSLGAPVIFDATHSVQRPGGMLGFTSGSREMIEPLARAAIATGIDGLFFETHPFPDSSPSDSANMVPLEKVEGMVLRMLKLHYFIHSLNSP
jgi:2-dehydro-3-deoxyphosphooctonate aldolase (KDO 8-P synthase)